MHKGALLCLLAAGANAIVQSPTYQFNVTNPVPNSPYLIGQKVPLVYDIAANTTSSNLQLSIVLVQANNATNSVVMVSSADISQGFSFQKTVDGGAVVYEHQYNYNIASNSPTGIYNVVYVDAVSQTNVTIPINVNAAQILPSSTSAANNPAASNGGSPFSVSEAPVSRPFVTPALIASLVCLVLFAY